VPLPEHYAPVPEAASGSLSARLLDALSDVGSATGILKSFFVAIPCDIIKESEKPHPPGAFADDGSVSVTVLSGTAGT